MKPWTHRLRSFGMQVIAAILLVFQVPFSIAQQERPSQPKPLSHSAQRIRHKVAMLTSGTSLDVRMKDGRLLHGSLISIEDRQFILTGAVPDRGVDVPFEDVQKVHPIREPVEHSFNPEKVGLYTLAGIVIFVVVESLTAGSH